MLAVSESCQSCSRILALEEDKATGNWKERSVCMGDTKTCSFPGLINHHHKFIISFAEDESGELYFMATTYPSAMSPFGTIFKFMDPSRRAPPGKCKKKPVPVKVRGKKIPFVPRELTLLDPNEKPTRPPPRKFKFTTKPRVAEIQIKPTTTAASVTMTTTTMMAKTSSVVKPKLESPVNKTRKGSKLKPWAKNKVLNKHETSVKKKMKTLKSKPQSKKMTVIKPVGGKEKVKPKTNHTVTADLKTNTLKTSNRLKDNTVHATKKNTPKKGAQKEISLQKNSIQVTKLAKEHPAFINETQTNLKANRTMLNKQEKGTKTH